MNFETFYPIHSTLKRHIEYYYFFKSDASDFSSRYYSFPNITTPINIHKNVKAHIDGSFVRISESKEFNYTIIVNQVRQAPLFVEWKGKLDKVTIVFKPLGLNNFIAKPFTEIVHGVSEIFTAWNTNPNHNCFLNNFFAGYENSERVALLEDFLMSVYCPFQEQAALDKAILLLSDFEDELTVNEIATTLGLTTRTFDRMFQKHMGVSPVSHKKIARFRHSLKNKLFNENFKKLTQIGYGSNFYDQSYFIKIYNKLTGTNPTTFFNAIEKLADNKLIFQFLSK